MQVLVRNLWRWCLETSSTLCLTKRSATVSLLFTSTLFLSITAIHRGVFSMSLMGLLYLALYTTCHQIFHHTRELGDSNMKKLSFEVFCEFRSVATDIFCCGSCQEFGSPISGTLPKLSVGKSDDRFLDQNFRSNILSAPIAGPTLSVIFLWARFAMRRRWVAPLRWATHWALLKA
jgi:hypothetical protein